jgi:hypothetical protein
MIEARKGNRKLTPASEGFPKAGRSGGHVPGLSYCSRADTEYPLRHAATVSHHPWVRLSLCPTSPTSPAPSSGAVFGG